MESRFIGTKGGCAMLSIIIGLCFICLSLFGFVRWWHETEFVLKGLLPLFIMLGGLIGLVAGITGLVESKELDEESKKGKD
jgi:hypothetical protein